MKYDVLHNLKGQFFCFVFFPLTSLLFPFNSNPSFLSKRRNIGRLTDQM